MATLEEFEHKFLPEAVASGGFGKDVEVLSVVRDGKEGVDQFASSVLFVNVKLKVDGEVKECPLVCKFQVLDEELRNRFSTEVQFFNEVLFYRDLLPVFKQDMSTFFPKYYFGKATLNRAPQDDVIMIEDLTPHGFRLTDGRIHLDVDHCTLAFRKLGEFHGASFVSKHQDEQIFKTAVSNLAEAKFEESKKEYINFFYSENAKRGVLPLLEAGEHVEILTRFLDRLRDAYGTFVDIFSETEMSVLCHGDFCRNNILFKYDSGRPVDVKFFDPATSRYASPVIDIAFFLFINTTVEDRRTHFKNDFLKAYLEGARKTAGEYAPKEEDLWTEFQEKGVYGYLISAFFLAIMSNDQPVDYDPTMSLQDRVKRVVQFGGVKVTNALKESVRDLITWGCLK